MEFLSVDVATGSVVLMIEQGRVPRLPLTLKIGVKDDGSDTSAVGCALDAFYW